MLMRIILEGNIQKQEGAKQERLGIRKDCVQPTEQTNGRGIIYRNACTLVHFVVKMI